MIELLSPAGNMEKLKTAFRYGADACYIVRTNVGTVVAPSLPDGCAVQTLTDCEVPTCNYKDYMGQDNETCSPGICNQIHVACTSASANYYLDNGVAKSCAVQDSAYSFSDGGNICSAAL